MRAAGTCCLSRVSSGVFDGGLATGGKKPKISSMQSSARRLMVYEAHCPAHGKTIPYLPLLELLRNLFGIEEQDGPREARQKIAGELALQVVDQPGQAAFDRGEQAAGAVRRQMQIRQLAQRACLQASSRLSCHL